MYSMYFSITYRCNQKCLCCPYTEDDSGFEDVSVKELCCVVDSILKQEKELYVVLSGGEPTLHPEFPELIFQLQKRNVSVHILSNGERFSDLLFLEKMNSKVNWEKLYVTTTLHSHRREEHEAANQKKGSFHRTLKGLHNLVERGAIVTVKHCVTGVNYPELKEFYCFVEQEFEDQIPVYLSGIDYMGISEPLLEKEKVCFPKIRPVLENLFDYILQHSEKRRVFCSHIPLCAADPYYWPFLRIRDKERIYKQSGRSGQVEESVEESGTHSEICRECQVRELCAGTYLSAFQVLGKEGFRPY